MDNAIEQKEINDLLHQNPLLALEACKQWITKTFNLPEDEITPFKDKPKYLSVKQWAETFGYIPEGGIRHLIFTNPEFNDRVVKRVGKKILLDVNELEKWVSEQKDHNG